MSAPAILPRLVIYALPDRGGYEIELHRDGIAETIAQADNREDLLGCLVAFLYGGIVFETPPAWDNHLPYSFAGKVAAEYRRQRDRCRA